MDVYRIVLARYADRLYASGNAYRWNKGGEFVVYTAGSRSLACLEVTVHASGAVLKDDFRLLTIRLPEEITFEAINPAQLPAEWYLRERYPDCQQIGSAWYQERTHLVLRVPSAVVQGDFNFVLNTQHPSWSSVELINIEAFRFDPRIKAPQ